jgi:ribosomal protein S12 methylthiotransferase accessory factor YcaO
VGRRPATRQRFVHLRPERQGPTKLHAKAGAMMEAIEHYCCERPPHEPSHRHHVASETVRWTTLRAASGSQTPPTTRFDGILTFRHHDSLDDIHFMSERLHAAGLDEVIVVDLTRPEAGFPVVKVIVQVSNIGPRGTSTPRWLL